MPIYEFSCGSCRRKVEIFRRSAGSTAPFACPACGSGDLTRLVSHFAVHRSTDVFAGAAEEHYLDGLDEGDPRAMAAYARRMAAESGEGMDPETEQMIAEMEAGRMPDDGGDEDGGYGDDLGF